MATLSSERNMELIPPPTFSSSKRRRTRSSPSVLLIGPPRARTDVAVAVAQRVVPVFQGCWHWQYYSASQLPVGSSSTNSAGTGSSNSSLPGGGSGGGGGYVYGSGGGSGLPPPPTYPVAVAEDSSSSARVWAHLGYGGTVLVGITNDLPQLVKTWGTAPRAMYTGMMVVGAGGLLTSLIASGRRSRACARLGSGLCTSLLVVDISCKTGRYGWIAGVACGGLIGAISIATWIDEETAARQAVAQLCRQAAEGAGALWGRVMRQLRRLKPASTTAPILPTSQIQL